MEINLYKTFSKRINSTKVPDSTPTTFTVNLKNDTSIQSPIFLLTGFDPSYNYVYVPSWGRYYFISDVVLGNTNLFEVHCTFDALASYKASIGAYTCFVERTSSPTYYNVDICDDALSVEDVVESQTSAPTTLFSSTGCYIVRLVGRDTSGIATFAFNSLSSIGNIFNPIFSGLFDSGDWSNVDIGDLVQAILCDPSKYIIGAYYSPIALGTYSSHGSSNQVYLGFFPTGQTGLQVSNPIYSGSTTLSKPTNIYSDFRKTDRCFSNYSMYLPAIGTVQLSPDIMDSTLTLNWVVDLLTGDIFYKLNSNGVLVATYNGNCYAPLQIGSGDVSGGTAFISDIISTASSVASKNVLTSGKNIIQGIKDIICPTPAINGSQGGIASMKEYPDVIISALQKHSAEFPADVVGRPCCKNVLLSNLNGHYVQCSCASIDNIAGTDADKELVNSYLNNGFYYE